MKTDVNERAVEGDNNPPLEITEFDSVSVEIHDLYGELKGWADGDPVSTQGQADSVAKLGKMLREADKRAEAHRKELVIPMDEAKKAVQDQFAPLIGKKKADGSMGMTVRALEVVSALLTPWNNKLQAERDEKARVLREAAEAKQREAEKAIRTANLAEKEAAEKLLKESQKLQATAKRAEKNNVKGMKTVWGVVVTDPQALLNHYWKNNRRELEEFARQLAEQQVRAKIRDIPGCNITSRSVAR